MNLTRDINSPTFTLGKLALGGAIYWTCEDPWVDNKPDVSCIPTGSYQVVINHSVRFNCDMPLLLNVPNRSGIRIHSGNTSADTEGCILIGFTQIPGGVGNSRAAFADFFPRLQDLLKEGPVELAVS